MGDDHSEDPRRTSPKFGDPLELPIQLRDPLSRVSTIPWRGSFTREALVYGAYIAQAWRLESCVGRAARIRRAAEDLFEHVGFALISGYGRRVLWELTEIELIAGDVLIGGEVRCAFAARARFPEDVAIGSDVRTATKCYKGARRLKGNLGLFEIVAEERRHANRFWRDRIDGARALRAVRLGARCFAFSPWRIAGGDEWTKV